MIKHLYLASDHAAVDLKALVIEYLRDTHPEIELHDLGTNSHDSVDYPDYGARIAQALELDPQAYGIALCGTGFGITIAANRFSHVRAAPVRDVTEARLTRLHNNANVLGLGARTTGIQTALDCVEAFLTTGFEGGRHQRRVDKLTNLC